MYTVADKPEFQGVCARQLSSINWGDMQWTLTSNVNEELIIEAKQI